MRNAWRQRHRLFCHEQDVVDEERSAKGRIRVSAPTPESGAVMDTQRIQPVGNNAQVEMLAKDGKDSIATASVSLQGDSALPELPRRASTAKCSRACSVPGEMMAS